MAGNSFGDLFRITTFGESHGPALGVVIDGCPPNVPLSAEDIQPDLDRRRPGQSNISTARMESDRVEILSGIFEGKTTGAPIALVILNQDARSRDYSEIKDKFRPNHADYTFLAKYGIRDYRGGGRSSARETVARVAAGAVAKKLMAQAGARVLGYTLQVGDIKMGNHDPVKVTQEAVEANPVRCPDADAAKEMEELIKAVRQDGDSIGGLAQIVVAGCPAGLGEPVFDKLKADLAKAVMSIPGVMGFEYGTGFGVVELRGSQYNDPFIMKDGAPHQKENKSGGMLGGISSGDPIMMRIPVKPTSSIPTVQDTVDIHGNETTIQTKGRHDPCLVPRFIPIGEAMVALVIADHLLRWRAIGGGVAGPQVPVESAAPWPTL